MGVSESISVVIMIGFSVDFVIHLSADYVHSTYQNRFDKMKQAYGEMGVSILSGAITTFGAGSFCSLGTALPVQKMSILIMSTIAISFIVSMVLFGAFMHIIGPQNGCGYLGWFLIKKKETKDEI